MIKIIKISIVTLLSLIFLAIASLYIGLQLSLPRLTGEMSTAQISQTVTIERDRLGTAVINGEHRQDVAYGLGFAHGQDRFFQMDLLRRNAAGELSELSELFGAGAIELDKRHRFHQLRKRAEAIFTKLPQAQQQLLEHYSAGVNAALAQQKLRSFEYILIQAKPQPWRPSDSILVIYSMYLDLQSNTINRDMTLTMIESQFGKPMRRFITQTSNYQAALDDSLFPSDPPALPDLAAKLLTSARDSVIDEPQELGSNNWAVTGEHTQSGRGMLSDDMHLSFAVPIIWYRSQLNYPDAAGEQHQVTGVTLPGAPAIVVGSNGMVAWGFTNAYIDTADWIALDDNEPITIVNETIKLPQGEVDYPLSVSKFGPVKNIDGQSYALAWVAHQAYAVDMELMTLETAKNVKQALENASRFGIPVQNLVVADAQGDAGWRVAGAYPARRQPSDVALEASKVNQALWADRITDIPQVLTPNNGLIWSANARVMSTQDAQRFGDGGYALGARSAQIRDRLQQQQTFDEQDFYQIQLDNQALFYLPWQDMLITALMSQPQRFAKDIQYLKQWQACACSDSIGFTLVKYFRSRLIDRSFAPLETELNSLSLSLGPVKRYLEPAMWQLLREQPRSWLPAEFASWQAFVIDSYLQSTQALLTKYSSTNDYQDLAWGKVNTLAIQHPFSRQMPILSRFLDMPTVVGFGDTFMPAVQGRSFGASQRFIVQPGLEDRAILTVPGGQSGHPLSRFYRKGFDEYAAQKSTPLLPQAIEEKLTLRPLKN
ncbi:penicillin acylase family protein [Shewanella sp. Isolate11]|uniref:penicillin acylase family protein n=1 Tax=Shewanella sp. Isolate11 TaxID=2908530 RepID=UPI001EFD9B6F|nr:penicillin acylase family protein [Shewanella sp. Isolate11]MCG9696118.1 penicillin acylase family protein [Shewanella sp. Isolate11]